MTPRVGTESQSRCAAMTDSRNTVGSSVEQIRSIYPYNATPVQDPKSVGRSTGGLALPVSSWVAHHKKET